MSCLKELRTGRGCTAYQCAYPRTPTSASTRDGHSPCRAARGGSAQKSRARAVVQRSHRIWPTAVSRSGRADLGASRPCATRVHWVVSQPGAGGSLGLETSASTILTIYRTVRMHLLVIHLGRQRIIGGIWLCEFVTLGSPAA